MRRVAAAGLVLLNALAGMPNAVMAAQEGSAPLRSGLSPPPALDDVRRASGVCRRDESPQPAQEPGSRRTEALRQAATCRLDVREASRLLGRVDTQLVDTRPRARFEALRIAQSLSATEQDLRLKPYWRSKHVVLVGEGRREEDLYRVCASLQQAGYKRVSVLGGGLAQWSAAGMPLVGQSQIEAPLRLTAEELWIESLFEHNAVFVDNSLQALVADLPRTDGLLDIAAEGAMAKAVERWRRPRRSLFLSSVIVVVPPGTPAARIDALRRQIDTVPLLVHEGSVAAVRAVAPTLQRIWAAHARGPSKPACGG